MTKNVPPTHLSNLMLLKVNGSGGDSSENGSTRKMASCSSNSDLNYSTTTGTGNTGTHNAKMLDLEKKQWKKPPQTVAYLAKLATLVELSPNVFRFVWILLWNFIIWTNKAKISVIYQ
jgi:hypothetical protein